MFFPVHKYIFQSLIYKLGTIREYWSCQHHRSGTWTQALWYCHTSSRWLWRGCVHFPVGCSRTVGRVHHTIQNGVTSLFPPKVNVFYHLHPDRCESETLCAPMDCGPPGFSVHGFLQTRILEWLPIPFSRGSSQLRDYTQVSWIAGRLFTISAIRQALSDKWWKLKWELIYLWCKLLGSQLNEGWLLVSSET